MTKLITICKALFVTIKFMKYTLLITLILSASLALNAQCEDAAKRAAFAQLSKSEQSRLWLERFDDYDRTHKMTIDQRHVWAKFREIISPEAFVLMNQPDFLETRFGQRFAAHWQRAKLAFTEQELNELFSLPKFHGRLEMSRPSCGCSPTWTFCGFSSECHVEGGQCGEVIDCGPFWQFICTGLCREVPINDLTRK